MSAALSYSLGLLTPFAILFAFAGALLLGRWIKRTVLYARPKYLERRINIAARVIDARRAYVIGSRHLQFALLVGRQWTREDQARAVLLDEYLPVSEESASTRK